MLSQVMYKNETRKYLLGFVKETKFKSAVNQFNAIIMQQKRNPNNATKFL